MIDITGGRKKAAAVKEKIAELSEKGKNRLSPVLEKLLHKKKEECGRMPALQEFGGLVVRAKSLVTRARM